jgi:hypothetical protein
MKRAWQSALTLCLLVALERPAALAEAPRQLPAQAPIELHGSGPYYQLTLPLAAHLAAHFSDMRDVRVLNGQGEMVPFSLLRGQARTDQAVSESRIPWFPLYATDAARDSLPDIRVERRADGTVVSVKAGDNASPGVPKVRGYLLDLSQSRNAARKLELDWDPAVPGMQQLSVEASDDLQTWRTWQRSAQVARLDFNGQRIERKQIELPGDHATYARIMWQVPQEAPALTSVTLTSSTSTYRPAPMVWSDPAQPTHTDTDEFEWQLPRILPIERLKIGLPQVNVLAPAEVWAKADAEPSTHWRLLTRAVLYRLQVDGKESQQQDVELTGLPVRAIKLKLDPRTGGLGSGVPTLSFGLTAQQVLFLARGQGPFMLVVGDQEAKSVDLPPATLIPGYDTPAAPPISTAELGPLGSPTPPTEPPQSAKPGPVDWKSATLWAVLLIGIATIAAMAFQVLRQMRS